MAAAFNDAITSFNTVINYITDLKLIGNLSLGAFIITIGILGSLITMILNYKR